jgi:putative ABC transport system permease protein
MWDPLIVRPMLGIKVEAPVEGNAEARGAEMNIQLIGYDTATGLGGPLEMVSGSDTPGADEVIVDEALRRRYGLDVGDTMWAGGKNWRVVGVSRGGDFVAQQTVFVTLEAAREALHMQDLTTFYVMTMTDTFEGDDVKKFTDDLELLQPGIVAFTRAELASETRERVLGDVLPILAMVLALAFIVGLAVAGLTIYTATVEKSREYGILKAVGFRNSYLFRTVLEQSIVTGVLGFAIGVGLTLLFSPFASDFVPQFVMFTRWQDIVVVAGATLVMSGVAAYIPVRRLASIDPVAVFKA